MALRDWFGRPRPKTNEDWIEVARRLSDIERGDYVVVHSAFGDYFGTVVEIGESCTKVQHWDGSVLRARWVENARIELLLKHSALRVDLNSRFDDVRKGEVVAACLNGEWFVVRLERVLYDGYAQVVTLAGTTMSVHPTQVKKLATAEAAAMHR